MTSRYDLFSACQGAAVENLKKNLEFSTFVSCLPTAVQKDEAFCKAIYQKLIEEVTRGIRESTDELSLRVGLKHKLDLLDKIVADPANATTDGSPAWRPTPNAQDSQSLRDCESLVAARQGAEARVLINLNSQLKTLEHDVDSISREVTDAAKEIDRVVSAMAISADSATTKDPLQHHFNSEEYENEGL